VSAVVEDDGRGFAETEVRPDALGLVGMRERLALAGGTLAIESTPGKGTSLVAYVPLAS
jgi:signal transduction histidine kinase